MVLETAFERASFDEIEGSRARVGSTWFPCIFSDEQAESLLVEGTAPELLCSAARLASVGVTLNTVIDEISTHDGRTKGPYKCVRWQIQDDGAFVVVGLQQQ